MRRFTRRLTAFLKYVAGVEHEDIELTVQIEEAVKRYNENEDWRQWAMTFGDRLEEAREEARAEGIKKKEKQFITQMIRMGFDDKTIQTAAGVADVNEIKKLRKMIMN